MIGFEGGVGTGAMAGGVVGIIAGALDEMKDDDEEDVEVLAEENNDEGEGGEWEDGN